MKRWTCAAVAISATVALWAPSQGNAAPAAAPVTHQARLGPLATAALSASAHGQRLPAAWLAGRASKRGTTYGVFLRGSTTANAIAATGAVPGTVLSVGATADATLSELHALAALPGITEVELAGQAGDQLDQSVPAIHASEPGHASTPGIPHMWSGTGGSADSYTTTTGGSTLWQQNGACPSTSSGAGRVPVLANGDIYSRNYTNGNEILNAATGQNLGTFTADLAPAFDGTTGFYVSDGILSAENSSGTTLWTFSGNGTTNSSPITAPIVVNGNVFVAGASGVVFALPEAGNGTSVNTPTWTGHTGTAILPIDDGQGDQSPDWGLGAGGGMVIVPATGHVVAFGDSTVTASSDTAVSYQIDAAHDGDQPSDSLTTPLAAAPKWDDNLGGVVSYPLIVGGLVFVIVTGDFATGGTAVIALNESNGSVAWGPTDVSSNGGQVQIAYDQGRVFVLGTNTQAFDASTGALDWTSGYSLGQSYEFGAPVAGNGVVYLDGSSLYGGVVLALSDFTGAVLWGDYPSVISASQPALSSTGLYISTACVLDIAPAIVQPPAPPTFAGDTGQGTVVGIVDTGIDISNEDFRTSAGTRIVDLWDQLACPDPSSNACPSQPPNSQGYDYGAECSQAQINASTCGPFYYGNWCTQAVGTSGTTANSWPEGDCDGHGTHVAGIAASNGRAAPWGTYIGVAPEADLVIVKSDENLADIIDGVAYVFKVAAARHEPASVNISLGTNEGPHDGSDMFETMLDALTGPGKLITVAGGNEATNDPTYHYHASAVIADGQVRTDGLLVEQMPVFIDLWYPGSDSISAAVSVTGEGQTAWVTPDTTGVSGEDGTCTQLVPNQDEFTDSVGNIFEILSCTHMPSNGMNEIQVAMFNPNVGAETLVTPENQTCADVECSNLFHLLLKGNSAAGTPYNAWTFDQGDYFFYKGDGNDNSTLDEPASAHDVISVGSYVTRNTWPSQAGIESDSSVVGAISSFSGHGPTLDGRTGIDIVAPGEEIGSSLSDMAYQPDGVESECPAGTPEGCISPDSNHLFLQGTSMASPHVAGALALLLAQQPNIDPAQAKSLLAQSANRSPLTSGGAATTWGAGKLELGPGVLSITAAEGSIAGGNTIDISGVDLQTGVGMSLGGRPLTLTNVGTNEWSAPVPAATEAGAVSLTITNPDGSTAVDPSAYVYLDPTAYHSLTPFRICDTRPKILTNQCEGKTLGARGSVNVQITGGVVPAGARAVVINLTAINDSAAATYVTAYPAGGTVPLASNINLNGSGARANLVVVQLSSSGAISIYNAAGVADVIADVQGYFAAPGGTGLVPGEFHSIPPLRICDTRAGMNTECAGATDHTLIGGQWRDVVLSGLPSGAVAGTPSIPSDGTAAAAVFNLTATGGSAATFLTVEPPNSSDACPSGPPSSSNVNPQPGTSLPNRVISPLGPKHDVCVFNAVGSINFIIDVDGWFGTGSESTAGALFNSVAPTRICDTRAGSPTDCAGMTLESNTANVIPVAGVDVLPAMVAGAPPIAVIVNLTAVAGTASTYFTLYPSDVAHAPRASDLNPVAGEVIANLSIVGIAQTGISAGDVSLYNAAGSINALLDVAGWFQ
jgi:subtilisin family serine protease